MQINIRPFSGSSQVNFRDLSSSCIAFTFTVSQEYFLGYSLIPFNYIFIADYTQGSCVWYVGIPFLSASYFWKQGRYTERDSNNAAC